jgi:glucosamine--fructose-6-phosphate aminotransferase (isomerizing)
LARCADVVLDCAAGAEGVVAATASVTAQMLLLRALASPLESSKTASLAEVAATILGRRAAPAAPPRHVVAAGFAAAWVADEVALKLAEMAGALASAESLVDHLHGPIAVPAPTVALLDPDDPNAARLAGADHVYSVGPSPDYDFVIPAAGDVTLDAIARTVAGQCLAWEVAVVAGMDPDEPRGLSKVTVSR